MTLPEIFLFISGKEEKGDNVFVARERAARWKAASPAERLRLIRDYLHK